MKRRLSLAIAVIYLCGIINAQIVQNFDEVTQASDLIFVGKVFNQTCKWNDKKNMIFTDVVFRNNSIIGAKSASLQNKKDQIILTFAGGRIDDISVRVSDMPVFENDHTYILCVKDDGLIYANPIVGGTRGMFEVISDPTNKNEYITNCSGKILSGFDSQNLIFSNQKVSGFNNGNLITKQKIDDCFLNISPISSDSISKVELVFPAYLIDEDIKPFTINDFINSIKNKYLKNTVIKKATTEGGYFYRNKDGKIVKEKIKECTMQGPDSLNNLNSLFNANETTLDPSISNTIDPSGGSLGACGFQRLPLNMEQVPASFWEYDLYNAMMWDWNQVIDIYRYSADNGYGANNGVNEIVNAISDANLYREYGFHWNSYVGLCVSWGGDHCTRITETDIMYNMAYSWTDDPNYAINNNSVILLQPTMMHELGHTWGEMTGEFIETYDYDVLSVMHSNYSYIYETGRGIHRSDAFLLRRQYNDQRSILSTIDVGIESYYANNGLHKSTSNEHSYYPGQQIVLNNMTAENIGYNAVSDVRLRFYLSANRTISTSNYQIGGSGSYIYWTNFPGESTSFFDFTSTIPDDIPPGDYYIGMIISVNGYNNDDFTANNTTSFSDPITIIENTSSYCSGTTTLTENSGSFEDGSGTNNYTNNSDCLWLIQPSGASNITLNFSSFNTESNCDFVRIYDGSSTSDPLLGEFSGSSIPSSITSTSGNMLVNFITDGSVVSTGWEAYYTSQTGPVIVEPPVTISIKKLASSALSDFIPDGQANEYFWSKVDENPILNLAEGSIASYDDNSGYFKAVWDESAIYLYILVNDDDPILYNSTYASSPWLNDCIELFIDGKDRRYDDGARIVGEQHQFRVNLKRDDISGQKYFYNPYNLCNYVYSDDDNAFSDSYPMQIGQDIKSNGYTMELVIPWQAVLSGLSDISLADIKANYQFAFEVSILDANTYDNRKSILNWSNYSGEDKSYYYNEYYGRVILNDTELSRPLELTVFNTIYQPIYIDGNLNEPDWYINESFSKVVMGSSDNLGYFGVLWDNSYLYVGAMIFDNNLYPNLVEKWNGDAIEIFLDGNNNGGSHEPGYDLQLIRPVGNSSFGVYLNGTDYTSNFSAILSAFSTISGGYTMEFAIPLYYIDILPDDGEYFGFDIAFDDNDDGFNRSSQIGWATNFTENYKDLSYIGRINLEKREMPPNGISVINSEYESIRIYPNPINDILNIKISKLAKDSELKIRDVNNRVLLTKTISNNQIQVDIKGFNPGIYFIEIQTNSERFLQPIIKK
jgi:hypothetical protein